MRFSWKALFLAPLAIPALYSVAFEVANPGRSPILAVLLLGILGAAVSYGATVFLLLPALFVLSRFRPLTAFLTGLAGFVLGGVAWVPVTWQAYCASGVDSGPPEGTFAQYLWRQGLGIDFWAFLLAGFVTAVVYWFLSTRAPAEGSSASSRPP